MHCPQARHVLPNAALDPTSRDTTLGDALLGAEIAAFIACSDSASVLGWNDLDFSTCTSDLSWAKLRVILSHIALVSVSKFNSRQQVVSVTKVRFQLLRRHRFPSVAESDTETWTFHALILHLS